MTDVQDEGQTWPAGTGFFYEPGAILTPPSFQGSHYELTPGKYRIQNRQLNGSLNIFAD